MGYNTKAVGLNPTPCGSVLSFTQLFLIGTCSFLNSHQKVNLSLIRRDHTWNIIAVFQTWLWTIFHLCMFDILVRGCLLSQFIWHFLTGSLQTPGLSRYDFQISWAFGWLLYNKYVGMFSQEELFKLCNLDAVSLIREWLRSQEFSRITIL